MTITKIAIVARQDRRWGVYAYFSTGYRECYAIDHNLPVAESLLRTFAAKEGLTVLRNDHGDLRATPKS